MLRSGFTVSDLREASLAIGWLFWNDYRRRRRARRSAANSAKPMPVIDLGRDL